MHFHDSKLKLVKALLFRSFHETEAPTACFCSAFICGRAYCLRESDVIPDKNEWVRLNKCLQDRPSSKLFQKCYQTTRYYLL